MFTSLQVSPFTPKPPKLGGHAMKLHHSQHLLLLATGMIALVFTPSASPSMGSASRAGSGHACEGADMHTRSPVTTVFEAEHGRMGRVETQQTLEIVANSQSEEKNQDGDSRNVTNCSESDAEQLHGAGRGLRRSASSCGSPELFKFHSHVSSQSVDRRLKPSGVRPSRPAVRRGET